MELRLASLNVRIAYVHDVGIAVHIAMVVSFE